MKVIILVVLLGITQTIQAGIIVSDFSISNNTVSLTVSGTIDGPLPPADTRILNFLPDTNGLGWVIPNGFTNAASIAGSISVGTMTGNIMEALEPGGAVDDEDWLHIVLSPTGPEINDNASGTITAIFPNGTFDTSVLQNQTWSLYWGDSAQSVRDGTFQSSFSAIPIPAAVWLFGSGLIGLIGVARRKVRV